LALLLQAENEYNTAVKTAVSEAENYADGCKKNQNAFIESLKQEWHLFEKSENEKFEKILDENEQNLEAKTKELKKQLKINQERKADFISERLKEEVLSLYGSR